MAKTTPKPKASAIEEMQKDRREPSPRELDAIRNAAGRVDARGPRFKARVQVDGQTAMTASPHADDRGWLLRLMDAMGTSSEDFALAELSRLLSTTRPIAATTQEGEANAGFATLDGARPKDEIETMLIAQMIATHRHGMSQLQKMAASQYVEAMAAHGNLATKLQRTLVAQVEALAKLRRGGEQTVRVEHVHVHSGGQAIVGQVTAGGGAPFENKAQTHDATDPRALAFTPGSPVWSPEPTGEAVPDGSGEGQETLPPSRGS